MPQVRLRVERQVNVTSTRTPYYVPSMDEIARIRGTNGYTLVSTFSGCGGSCLGFEMAGFDVRVASEFIPAARETYAANHPHVVLDGRDIRDVRASDLLELAGVDEIDVLEGSPPCASFSTAGKRHEGWGDVRSYSDSSQRSDDLFFEYARLVKELQPKVFVAENVTGLVKGSAKGYFKMIITRLRECGYVVEARVLDASQLGVPQKRQRVIFVGVRNDLGRQPAFPKPRAEVVTMYDALGENLRVPDDATNLDPETGQDLSIRKYKVGEAYLSVPLGKHNARYFQLSRPDPTRPAPTICASVGSLGSRNPVHPFDFRYFNLRELRRLCGFPDDFILHGHYSRRAERLGRAVPPLMMREVAATVRDEILATL